MKLMSVSTFRVFNIHSFKSKSKSKSKSLPLTFAPFAPVGTPETCSSSTSCLSDPEGHSLNFNPTDEADRDPNNPDKDTFTGRGSSQNENLHKFINKICHGKIMGGMKCDAVVTTFFHRWNVNRDIQKRGRPDFGSYHVSTAPDPIRALTPPSRHLASPRS